MCCRGQAVAASVGDSESSLQFPTQRQVENLEASTLDIRLDLADVSEGDRICFSHDVEHALARRDGDRRQYAAGQRIDAHSRVDQLEERPEMGRDGSGNRWKAP